MRSSKSFLTKTATAACLLASYLLLACSLLATQNPEVQASLSVDNRPWSSVELPVSLSAEVTRFIIDVSPSGFLKNRKFLLRADDCLENLSVNDKLLPIQPGCQFPAPTKLDLSFDQNNDPTRIKGLVRNLGNRSGLWFRPAGDDLTYLSVALISPLLVYFLSLYLIKTWCEVENRLLYSFASFGFLVRLVYFLFIPYWLFSYDAEEHLDYIFHIEKTSSIPAPDQGWQYYQNPLYYLAAAGTLKVSAHLGYPSLPTLKFFSLFLSLIGFLAVLQTARIYLRHRTSQIVAFSIAAIAPLLIMPASRISNDTLTLCLVCLSILCTAQTIKSRRESLGYLALVLASLAFLSKTAAIPVLISNLVFLSVIFRSNKKWIVMAWLGSIAICSPAPVRSAFHGDSGIVGQRTIATMNPSLRIDVEERNYFSFDLARVLETPYNQPHGENQGKNNFLEYFFLSSLTGEFAILKKGPISFALFLFTFLIIGLTLVGMATCFRKDKSKERYLLLVTLTSLGAVVCFSALYPYSPAQEARHVPWIVITISVFTARGLELLLIIQEQEEISEHSKV